jgi:hypothetical protein
VLSFAESLVARGDVMGYSLLCVYCIVVLMGEDLRFSRGCGNPNVLKVCILKIMDKIVIK